MSVDPALQRCIDRVLAARSDNRPLAIRGGGTKDFYGGPITGHNLDVRSLRGISSYEPSELVITARSGTPLSELEAALAEKGQCLPFEPPRYGVGAVGSSLQTIVPVGGTLGGMVAAGLAGPGRANAGSVRDYVLGATLLNGLGEVLSFGGQVMKNVAGYDVSRVLAGSMGILGVICEVSLKVLPKVPATATLRFELDEATAIHQMNVWGGQPLPITAAAFWQGALVLRLGGAGKAVEAAVRQLGGDLIEDDLAASFWTGLRDQTDEYFLGAQRALASGAALWRLSVPATTAPLPIRGEQLIEWGGAQRWWVTHTPAAQLREMAARVGGHATLFRAKDKAAGVFTPLAPPLERIHRDLKKAFDPDGVFNRGRLIPGL
jgi:glycolate oxidase FAD binding subunit